ncbi:MAG TPA: hypothetical protein VE338_12640 [Ktedonobacterales bacterium]|nr:hypothetical protein [Ktedonobacterales bacterium]
MERTGRRAFVSLLAEDGFDVIVDGAPVGVRTERASHFGALSKRYGTSTRIAKSLRVYFPSDEIAILFSIVDMYSRPEATIIPTLNAIRTLLAQMRDDARVAHSRFQNTPTQWSDWPDVMAQMATELQR